ncbi:CoA-binding protein [bacterium]|nr:CoA-binding protein [bacterium]
MNQPKIVKELEPLFQPNSVAVIGASNNVTKWGYSTYSSLRAHYKGRLYAVNNKADKIQGQQAFPNIRDVPDPVDLAVIVVPAERVKDVMDDCVTKGVRAAVIISAGFAEIGPQGKAMQDAVLESAKKGGIRLVGPNCMGMWSAVSNLTAFMFPMNIKEGPFSLISQGGNIGGAVVADSMTRGIGFQQYISCGCTADIQIEDYIEYAGYDDSVKVILVYIEGLNDGARFIKKVGAVTRKKPVIVLKPGKTEAAAKAISSHSGSMSGVDSVYESAFKKAGVIRVDTSIELLDTAIALLYHPLPKGRNVVVTTPGGSYGVMCADACALRGLKLIDLPATIMEQFNTMFPPRWSHGNPVDPAGDRDMIQYLRAPKFILENSEVDALIFMGFGSFSAISSVFASSRDDLKLDRIGADSTDMKVFGKYGLKILESADPVQIKGLIQTIMNHVLEVLVTSKKADVDEFVEAISTALVTEKMLKRSLYVKLKRIFGLLADDKADQIKREEIVELMEPIIDALLENWIDQYGKPVITTTFTEDTSKVSEGGHFPYPNSDRAAAVLSKMVGYAEYLERE